jgi:hypothetical protein
MERSNYPASSATWSKRHERRSTATIAVAEVVDAAPTGAPGELGVLARP